MLSENMASFLVSPQNPWEGDLGVLVDLLENVLILSWERETLAFIFPILGPEFNVILPICAFGFLELLERPEISSRINFLAKAPFSDETALHIACKSEETETIKYLLGTSAAHALLTAEDKGGRTALWTVLDSHIPATIPEMLELLLDGGADMFKTNTSEQSAYEKVMTSICNTREE